MLGRTLGPYRIQESLGAGGMGVVYRAHDDRLHRPVAIKLLSDTSLSDEAARARLLREARSASALNHPNICTIYEVGEADGRPYIVMEYIEGRPLSQLIPSGGLPVDAVLRYGRQIADALAHAHERGVVHGDLKSANVVVTTDGRAKVLDFGLARRVGADLADDLTHSQHAFDGRRIQGTLSYLAPEVLRGNAPDAQSDIWMLGVVLYEMAAGQLPFQGSTAFEVSSAILKDSPGAFPEHLPPVLRAIISRCLGKEPAHRYQRASDVRAALETVESGLIEVVQVPDHGVRWRPGLLTVVGVLIAVMAILLALNLGSWRDRLLGRGSERIQALAVLPLTNLSGDPEQEYFADGMTEALITDLARLEALRVISRTSVMQYKGVRKPLPEIARALKVDAIVEGSVQRVGNRVRITAQLIHALSDRHLWANQYERDLKDILSLQSEVARAIAEEVKVQLTPQDRTRLSQATPVDPEVHQLYLKGRFHWNKRTNDGFRKAIEYFEAALRADSRYARAHAGLADAYALLARGGSVSPRVAMPRAKTAAAQALQLDETLAEAHTSLGWVAFTYDWDWAGAELRFKRAIQLNPGYATAHHWYAIFLTSMGRREEGIAEIKRAQELDPLSLIINANVAWVYQRTRRYDQAIEQCRKTLELDPNFGVARVYLGEAYEQMSMHPEAIGEYQKATALFGGSQTAVAALREAYAKSGTKGYWRRRLDLAKDGFDLSAYDTAEIYIRLGESDQAFEWLEEAYEERATALAYLNVEPLMDPIRSDPRFIRLLERIGLTQGGTS